MERANRRCARRSARAACSTVSTLLKPRALIAYSRRVDLLDLEVRRQPQHLGQRGGRRVAMISSPVMTKSAVGARAQRLLALRGRADRQAAPAPRSRAAKDPGSAGWRRRGRQSWAAALGGRGRRRRPGRAGEDAKRVVVHDAKASRSRPPALARRFRWRRGKGQAAPQVSAPARRAPGRLDRLRRVRPTAASIAVQAATFCRSCAGSILSSVSSGVW